MVELHKPELDTGQRLAGIASHAGHLEAVAREAWVQLLEPARLDNSSWIHWCMC